MRTLLAAYALFSIGAGVMLFYLPLHLFSLGGSLFEVALITTIPALVSMVFSGVWGKLSDELKTRKLFIIIGMAAMSGFFLSMPVLKTKSLLLMSLAGFTVLTCATEPAIQAYVTSLLRNEKGAAAGMMNAYNYVGISTSALFGGFLYDHFGFSPLAILSALSAAAATIILLFGFREKLIVKTTKFRRNSFSGSGGLGGGVRRVITRMFPIYLYVFLVIVGMATFGPLSAVYLIQLGNSRTIYGIACFVSFMGAGLVSQRIGRLTDRHGRKIMLLAGGVAYSAVFIFLYFVKSPLLSLFAWSVPLYPLGWIASTAVVGDRTTENERGLGMGLLNSFKNVGLITGSLAGGVLAVAGIGNVLVFAAIASTMAVLLAITCEF